MTITLNLTNPTGQTWTYKIPKADKILRVTSSSPYFLYEVTPNELIIKAKIESQQGDTITATDGTITNTYTLDKTGLTPIHTSVQVYYGNSASVPESHTGGTAINVSGNSFKFTATLNVGWVALPIGVQLTDIVENAFLGSFMDSVLTKIDGNYTIYYIEFFGASHLTNLTVYIL